MAKYTVTINETVSEDFSIEADSMEDAINQISTQYSNGDIVVKSRDDVMAKARCFEDGTANMSDWETIFDGDSFY